jgi:hypothetical protein
MGINNFPAALQPIIQQGYLEREFEQALHSKLGYRDIADREIFAVGIGETLTKTRAGLKPSVTTPLSPSTNTNLDNGLTPEYFSVEQYTLSINLYGATTDLNMVTSRVAIASQFLLNAQINGEQARRSLDELARNALFNAYFSGNTRVTQTLSAPGPTISVDDVRGFQNVWVNGVPTPVSTANPLTVTVGSDVYQLVGVNVDANNVSTAPGGMSGELTFSTNVSVADGTAGNTVQAANAAVIIRPSGRTNTSLLQPTDTLTMSCLLDAVAKLRLNNVPDIDGVYHCHLDPASARQLFADPDFKELFTMGYDTETFRRGELVSPFLGLRFVPTTEAYVQPAPGLPGLYVRRPIVCGRGALIEGDYAGMMDEDIAPRDAIIHVIDGIAMVTREPIDRLQQIIAQSWYWIGGFCAPTDITTNPTTIPTATNSAYKRAVMIEHIG